MPLAQSAGVKLLLLPENFAQIPAQPGQLQCEHYGDGVIQRFIAGISRQYRMTVVAGSVPIQTDAKQNPYARSLVYDDTGAEIAVYDKLHLFDVDLPEQPNYRESANYSAGVIDKSESNLSVVKTAVGQLGLSICYDLRFPEMYRCLVERGAEIFAVPAAFTYATGRAHWSALLRARAIENQSFVLAAAQVGQHDNGRRSWGHSMIIGPWGDVLAEFEAADKSNPTGLLISDIDLIKQAELRNKFPTLRQRRL